MTKQHIESHCNVNAVRIGLCVREKRLRQPVVSQAVYVYLPRLTGLNPMRKKRSANSHVWSNWWVLR
ncbi:hypothetical protein ACVJBD_000153 [Rhizobium mongolense]